MKNYSTISEPAWRLIWTKCDRYYTDSFNTDFYIRKNRNQIKDVARVLHSIQSKKEVFHKNTYLPIWEKIKEHDTNNTKCVYFHVRDNENDWRKYKMQYNENYDSWTVGFDFLNRKPNNPLLIDLGKEFYNADKTMDKFYERITILTDVLKSLLEDKCNSIYSRNEVNYEEIKNKIIKFNIDGYCYWYSLQRNYHGVLVWKPLIWNNEEIVEFNI